MGRKPRNELPKRNKRKKHKGQAPPPPFRDPDEGPKGRKRKRSDSNAPDADNKKPMSNRAAKRRKGQEFKAKGKAKKPDVLPPKVEEEEVEVTEEDMRFFADHQEALGFLDELSAKQLADSTLNKQKLKREMRKQKKAQQNKPADYEQRPRREKVKQEKEEETDGVEKLPTKDSEGLLRKSQAAPKLSEEAKRLRAKAAKLAKQQNGELMNDDVKSEQESEEEEESVVNRSVDDSGEVEEDEEEEKGAEEKKGGKEEEDEEDDSEEEEEEDEDDEEEEEDEDDEVIDFEEEEEDERATVSSLKKIHKEQSHIEEMKARMAAIGSQILGDADTHLIQVKELLEMCHDKMHAVRKYAILSLLAIFKDVIPGYRIRLPTEKEKNMKVSRDQKQMRAREALLLNSYQQYLQILDSIIKDFKIHKQRIKRQRKAVARKKSKDRPVMAVNEQIEKEVREQWMISVKCLSELLKTHSHFNFSWNIVSLLVPLLNADDDKLRALCCSAIEAVFENDVRGSITLQTVKLVGQFVKAKSFNVKNEVLATFLHIKFLDELKEGDVTLDPVKQLSKKERKNMPKSKYKAFKEMREIEQEMKEAEAEQSKEEKKRVQTEILRTAFITYFRILKKAQKSPLLPAVLEGLARYTHFINADFITDIVAALRELIGGQDFSTQLSVPVRIQCAVSALELAQKGATQTLNTGNVNVTSDTVVYVDMKDLYTRLYEVLLELPPHAVENPHILLSLLRCLNLISRDKKQLSTNRTAAFIKRVATLALQLPPNATLGLISIMTDILNKHPKIQQLLDNDHDGSGVFMPELNDPEHCNALASTLWEFALLKHHYQPHLKDYVAGFLKFFEKQSQAIVGVAVPQQHVLAAETLYNKFDYNSTGVFNPPLQVPGPHPFEKLLHKYQAKDAKRGKKRKPKRMYIRPSGEESDFMQFLTLSASAEVDDNDFESYDEELTSFYNLTQ